MPEEHDFEKAWLSKLSTALKEIAGDEIHDNIMEGSQHLSDSSPGEDIISWSINAMEDMEMLLDVESRKKILLSCACQYPKDSLSSIKEAYAETGNIELAHQMLQEHFILFLRDVMKLGPDIVDDILARGWGTAGILDGKIITATKIPKSGYIAEYMEEPDSEERRKLYCHCPRIRDVLKSGETISATYCYCGAGFYKGIWEEIIGRQVDMEILSSVLKGDEVCSFLIILPDEDEA